LSKDRKFCGVVVPMISPFTRDGAIDVPAAGRIAEHLVAGGVGGVFPLGTTGESASIHPTEKRKLVAATVKAVAGRATVYAGISGNCYKESVEAAAEYRDAGADALVAHPASYYPLGDGDIENYFRRLADAVPLPLVLYNIPATTHHTIAIDTVLRLRDHGNIVAIKDSANDPQRITQLLQATGGRGGFPVLLGCSVLFSHGLKAGAVGLVPSGAHLVPDLYQKMYIAAMDQRWQTVDEMQKQTDAVCLTYLKGRRLGESLAVLKALLEKKGLCGRTMLPPIQDFHGDI
jgi:dihydrodipicolinate synthase/N-acetylneuraminate lyase